VLLAPSGGLRVCPLSRKQTFRMYALGPILMSAYGGGLN